MAGKFSGGLPQAGQAFGSGVFVAGTHFHAKADLEVGHKITVIHMAGTPHLLGIITNFAPSWRPLSGFAVTSISKIQGRPKAAEMVSIICEEKQSSPAVSGMRYMAGRTAFSLTVPGRPGFTPSPRTPLIWA